MALFNYASKEVTLKVVYYGPGLSGKTTNLQYLHPLLDKEKKSKLLSLSTEADRTLFFDFLPVELGKIKDFAIRFQLYTVPGQVRYNATRRLVLKGADAVVFVADSQRDMREQNIESLANMRENLIANNIDPDTIPIVLQYNKRDLPNILTVEELNKDLNEAGYPIAEASAINGTGVMETFQLITKLLIEDISKKHRVSIGDETPSQPEIEPPPQKAAKAMAYEEAKLEDLIVREREPEPSAYEAVSRAEMLGEETEEKQPEIQVQPEALEKEINEEAVTVPSPETMAEEIKEIEEELLKTSEPVPTIAGTEAIEEYRQRIEDLTDTVKTLSMTVNSLKDTIERLARQLSETKTETYLKDLPRLQGQIENALNEFSKEAKESKNRQHEILGALKELKFILSNLKTKKSWFQI